MSKNEPIDFIFHQMKKNFILKDKNCLKYRKQALEKLIQGYEAMKNQIDKALELDLGYNSFISNFAAHSITMNEVTDLLKSVKNWMKPQMVANPIIVGLSTSSIEYEPLGLVLIMSAWNYPIYTAIPQVAAAIAAGNSIILKPSQMAPNTSKVLKRLFTKYMNQKYYTVIQGEVDLAKKLSQLPFDMICFTGSSQTGKLIASSAAKNLTPCLLQLGGKCPTIVDQTASIDSAVDRVMFGKFLNCGQTCVGVDHVYIHKKIYNQFRQKLLAKMQQVYKNIKQSNKEGDYGKIINVKHFERLIELIDNSTGQIIHGGSNTKNRLFIQPTIIEQPSMDSKLMKQEIFGPILPIMPYTQLTNVIKQINQRPKPLSIYMFSSNKKNIQQLKNNTSSGSFVTNDTVVQLLNCHLPFGGVGQSGYGRYHGQAGFKAFSNPRSICYVSSFNQYPLTARFPPYTYSKKKALNFLLKIGQITYQQLGLGSIIVAACGILTVGAVKIIPHL